MTHTDLVLRSLEALADPARRDAYFDLYSADIVLHGYEGVEPGLKSVKAFYDGVFSAFPDATVQAEDIFETGDKVTVRFVLRGTHKGTFNGIPATGRLVQLPGITILRFEGGKCVERWSCADFVSLMKQLGAL